MKQCLIVGQSREPIIGHLHLLSATHFNILKTLSKDSGMSSGWKKYDSNTLVYDLWIYQLHFSWTACILLAICAAYILVCSCYMFSELKGMSLSMKNVWIASSFLLKGAVQKLTFLRDGGGGDCDKVFFLLNSKLKRSKIPDIWVNSSYVWSLIKSTH